MDSVTTMDSVIDMDSVTTMESVITMDAATTFFRFDAFSM
jgi:hypothetical protein